MRMSLLGSASNRGLGFGGKIRPQRINLSYMIAAGGGTSTGGGWGGVGGGVVLIGIFTNYSTIVARTATVGGVTENSSFNGLTAAGGIPRTADYGSPIPGYVSGGNAAYWGWDESTWTTAGGGGTGMGGGGSDGAITDVWGQMQPTGGTGGPGILWSSSAGGNDQYYGAGTGGQAYAPPGISTFNGENGTGYGNAGSANCAGQVIVSYQWPVMLFTGGAPSSTGVGSSRRIFHTLSNGQTLTPLY